MDLDLELEMPHLGRRPVEVTCEVVREVAEADLELLRQDRGIKPLEIKRLTQRHHALARSLASGMTPGRAAILCGYTPSHVSILQTSPAFQELLWFYQNNVDVEFVDMLKSMNDLGDEVLEEIRRRVEEEPEDIGFGQLLKAMELVADRTGRGPVSTQNQTHVHVHLASRLQDARKRVEQMRQINGEANAIEKRETGSDYAGSGSQREVPQEDAHPAEGGTEVRSG